ncbi:hydrolase [Metallosphaera tengchongensis]|uniref:Hydrolase n=1 Tax=Metallosphaera tengchongensis TaxID=1532350 RepID=A0A6N0NUY2_9CREN|nr:MBL fold metallo-hydrolase [Metallosphaera tengchongensis]QKR00542.1 hydrolase [Metallosphaera tengchongensis]
MIRLFGHSMVSIDNSVVIDPHDGGSIGLPKPIIGRTVQVLITHDHYDHNAFQNVESKDVKIGLEGSLEVGGYKIEGFRAYHDNLKGKKYGKTSIYQIKGNSISFLHMGDIGEFPSERILKNLSADIVAIPIGGIITIGHREAQEIIKIISPTAVIPLHYWVRGLLMPLDPPEDFIKYMNWNLYKTKEIDENNLKKGIYLFDID